MADTIKLPLVGPVHKSTAWVVAIAGVGALGYGLWKKKQDAAKAAAASTAQGASAQQYGYGAEYGYGSGAEYGYGSGNSLYNYGYGAFAAGEEAGEYYGYGYNAGLAANSNTGSTSTGGGQTSTTPANQPPAQPVNQTGSVTARNGAKTVKVPVQTNNGGDTWYATSPVKISPANQVAHISSSTGGSAEVGTTNGGLTWSFLK